MNAAEPPVGGHDHDDVTAVEFGGMRAGQAQAKSGPVNRCD